jgi:hypothetical protein
MVDKAATERHKAPHDQCGAGGSDSEIEITPQMIEAGAEAVLDYQWETSIYEARNIAEAVLMAAMGIGVPTRTRRDRR